jgi:hypothetical protein
MNLLSIKLILKKDLKARHQWLMPEILATQEDSSLKQAYANSSQDPILKNPITKKGWWSGQGVARAQTSAPKKKKGKKKEVKTKGLVE